jgi:hypothetical protein
MMALNGPVAAGNSYTPAIYGLIGSLIGGFIAGTVSLLVARQARAAAEGAWIRDNRREIYDRLLRCAEKLLHACEACKGANGDTEALKARVGSAFTNFWEVYGVVQTVAGMRLVVAVRVYSYRLWELAASLGTTSVMGPENFDLVMKLIRDARHDMIDVMRAELGLDSGIRPSDDYNPFAGTELEQRYAQAERSSPGPWPFLSPVRRSRPAWPRGERNRPGQA